MEIREEDVPENLYQMLEIVGSDNFREIIRLYGGDKVYLPTYNAVLKSSKKREILRRYNGINASQLSIEYGVSVNYVRKLVRENDTK